MVFISYSHDSDDHKQWVIELATYLRFHGVDVILDQWDLSLGKDLRFFMEHGITSSRLVICVCSENYVLKADSGRGGVGYETMIMTQDLLEDSNSNYIIPIVRNNPSDKKVPTSLRSKLYLDFSDDEHFYDNYRKLLERIYEEDQLKKPTLGENPFCGHLSEQITLHLKSQQIMYMNPDMEGIVEFLYDNNNGTFLIGSGKYLFETRWSRYSNNGIYAIKGNKSRIGYKSGNREAPHYDDILTFNFSSGIRTVMVGQVFIIENEFQHYAAIKVVSVESRSHERSEDCLVFNYHIYQSGI